MQLSTMPEWRLASEVNDLRREGYPDDEIAVRLALHPGVVKSIPLPKPQPVRQRAVQHLQLQRLVGVLMPKAEAGDLNAAGLLIKVMQREATLLGLDAPKETIVHNNNLNQDDLRNLSTEQLKQMVMDQLEAGRPVIRLEPDGAGGFAAPADSPPANAT